MAEPSTQKKQIPIVCPGHTRPLAELQFCKAPDDRILLASACHDKLPMLRDGVTGDWIGTWRGHKGAVWSCRLTEPNAHLAVSAGGDYSVRVWDAITGACLATLPHAHICKCADVRGDWLATAGHEGVVRLFAMEDVLSGAKQNGGVGEVKVTAAREMAHPGLVIHKLSWWNDTTVLTGASDGVIRFWKTDDATSTPYAVVDTKSGAEIRDMELTTLTTTGQRILSIASGKSVYFYEYDKLLKSYEMPIHFRDEGGVSLHPDGTQFIAGGSDLWVRVFEFATGQELACLKGHVSDVCLADLASHWYCYSMAQSGVYVTPQLAKCSQRVRKMEPSVFGMSYNL